MHSIQTPSQTVGPFFHYGLIFGGDDDLLKDGVKGQRINLIGAVYDAHGDAVSDAMVEIWQADSQGIYPNPADSNFSKVDPYFKGFGRSDTKRENQFRFSTVKPGKATYQKSDSKQAPHINLRIFGRGLLVHLQTRIYFEDESIENEQDPVYKTLDPIRRRSLLAKIESQQAGTPIYRFDVVLQGENETLFFQP